MSQVTHRELFPGVWLRTVHTNKFKSSYLSLTLDLSPNTVNEIGFLSGRVLRTENALFRIGLEKQLTQQASGGLQDILPESVGAVSGAAAHRAGGGVLFRIR